jgi:hypothetical protein
MAALRAAEMLKSFGGTSGNPLNALLSFLQPLLEDRDGQRFDPKEFAEAVRKAYGWNFTEDVADGFRTALREKGWLQTSRGPDGQTRFDQGKAVHVVCCPPTNDGSFDQPIDDAIERITTAFKSFLVEQAMPIDGVYRSDDDMISEIVSHLVENFGQKRVGASSAEAAVAEECADEFDNGDHDDQRSYQVGRFVSATQQEGGPLSHDFDRIAAVGLLAELAQDFAKPTTKVSKSRVAVYLDSPIAHDLVGASGKQTAAQTRSVIKKLRDMGATINIFDQSVKEMQISLRTILGKAPAERFGAIQEAFLRGELDEAYVHTVVADPARALQEWGVQVKSVAVQNALKPDHFFSNEQFHRFFSKLVGVHDSDQRAEVRSRHDANAVAYMMRLRKGHESDDLFQSQHFFLTRNRAFASLARGFCVEEDLLSPESVGPFVTMFDLAASVWLRTGLYENSMEIPRRRLLAGCERVLALKGSVVRKAQREILKLRERPDMDEEKMRQIEAILSQDRSRMLISDRIRGSMKELDEDDLLDIYRRVLADEESKGYQKGRLEVAEDRDRVFREKVEVEAKLASVTDAAQQRETALGSQVEGLQSRIDNEQAARHERLDVLLSDVNRAVHRLNMSIAVFLIGVALLIFLASFWKEFFAAFEEEPSAPHHGMSGHAFLFACGLLPALVLIVDQAFRLTRWERPIERWIVEPWARRRFVRMAEERGLWDLLGPEPQDSIDYIDGTILLRRSD